MTTQTKRVNRRIAGTSPVPLYWSELFPATRQRWNLQSHASLHLGGKALCGRGYIRRGQPGTIRRTTRVAAGTSVCADCNRYARRDPAGRALVMAVEACERLLRRRHDRPDLTDAVVLDSLSRIVAQARPLPEDGTE